MKPTRTSRRKEAKEALRFLALGSLNTGITFLIFMGLSIFIPNWGAYSISYCLGLVINGIGTSQWVFNSKLKFKTFSLYLLWYLLIFAIGQLVIWILSAGAQLDTLYLSMAIILVTTPLSFLGGRFIFRNKNIDPAPPERLGLGK